MIICRVCLDNNDTLIPLISDNADARPLVYMLNGFTIINAEKQLPKYICETCAAHLDAAYSFKRKYEDSIVRFVRQTSYNEESDAMITCESSRTSKMYYQRDFQLETETMRLSYLTEYDLTTDEDNDGQVLTKLISLGDRPPNDAERLNSDDDKKDRCHGLAGYSNIWNENYANLSQKHSDNGSVHEALEGPEAVQGSQDISSVYQESNLLPDVVNNQDDDGLFQCEVHHQDIHNQTQEALLPYDMFNSHERNDVYNNQETDGESSHSCIYQQDMNNEDGDSNILPDDVISNRDDETLSLENPNSCCTEQTNQPNNIDNENGQQDELLEYLKLKRSETASPEIFSKVYHYGYGMKPLKCDVCCRWFKTERHIRAHLFHHYLDEKKIKCRKCRLTFLTEPHFRNHRCVSPI
ncbi:uncharacterized protein LOC119076599 isoform X2 [Bradysia coprophila]|uniref:uncharacterized protein LOC119076599 isoform X2 n=1 Tax=Bradysia coprophila TaxID=38358 RepID=UPI00187D99BA|nr:uncharacterized protein LOC119076599 isoform X2 [Bradysia coprophila]